MHWEQSEKGNLAAKDIVVYIYYRFILLAIFSLENTISGIRVIQSIIFVFI